MAARYFFVRYDGDPREFRREISRAKLDSTVTGLWGLFRFIAAVLILGGLARLLGA